MKNIEFELAKRTTQSLFKKAMIEPDNDGLVSYKLHSLITFVEQVINTVTDPVNSKKEVSIIIEMANNVKYKWSSDGEEYTFSLFCTVEKGRDDSVKMSVGLAPVDGNDNIMILNDFIITNNVEHYLTSFFDWIYTENRYDTTLFILFLDGLEYDDHIGIICDYSKPFRVKDCADQKYEISYHIEEVVAYATISLVASASEISDRSGLNFSIPLETYKNAIKNKFGIEFR